MNKYVSILLLVMFSQFGCENKDNNVLSTRVIDTSWAEGIYFFEYKINGNEVREDPFITPSIIRSDTLILLMRTESSSITIVIDGFTGEGTYTNKTTHKSTIVTTPTSTSYQWPHCGYSDIVIDSFSQEGYISGSFDGGVAFLMCDDPPSNLYTEGKFALLHE